MRVKIREYSPEQFQKLHQVFIGAFSDYFVGFKPTEAQFNLRVNQKLNIAPEISALAWKHEKPIGFILHTLSSYQGKVTAYNGGTGVLPEYRRLGVTKSVYEFLLAKLVETPAQRILLEMIDRNQAASKLYESLGFQFTRVFKCFRQKSTINCHKIIPINTAKVWNQAYNDHFSFQPSFMDSPEQIVHNLQNEIILEAHHEGGLVGHLIFQPQIGRISQLAVKKAYRNQGIGRALLSECQKTSKVKSLTIMNIPEDQHETIEALRSLGFENELNQFELELIL